MKRHLVPRVGSTPALSVTHRAIPRKQPFGKVVIAYGPRCQKEDDIHREAQCEAGADRGNGSRRWNAPGRETMHSWDMTHPPGVSRRRSDGNGWLLVVGGDSDHAGPTVDAEDRRDLGHN